MKSVTCNMFIWVDDEIEEQHREQEANSKIKL